MTTTLNVLLNSAYTALILFTVAAAAASIFARSPLTRVAAGAAVALAALYIPISGRSLFGWGVSTVERPSIPGLVLLGALAISAISGWRIATSAEYRFATLAAGLAGLVLYPAATGIFDYDTYVWGFSGYLLPVAIAVVIAYAIFRGYLVTALVLNIAIAAFLIGAGLSRNLWDYVIDPVAMVIGFLTWSALAAGFLISRFNPKALAPVQPSSGIGDTPISH